MTTIPLMVVVAIMSLFLSSCQKKSPTLGALPVPNFKSVALTPTSDSTAANMELINTTPTAGIAYWNIPGVGTFKGDTVKATFVFAGTYPVQLVVAGEGGIDSVTQTVNVANNNTFAVGPTTLLGVLTGAGLGKTQRTWIAERVVNSVIVWDNYTDCLGQIHGGGGAWWAFGAAEIASGTGRDGYLDDQYTFTFAKVGQFIYNDNNTVYLDDGGSGWTKALPAPWNGYLGTYASTTDSTITTSSQSTPTSTAVYGVVPALKPWGSGTFGYSIAAAPAGAMKLGTITVNGLGAHIGLPDKANSGDELTPTATSVTYDVLQINTGLKDVTTSATYDEIILGVQDAGIVWTYMLRSNR